MKKNRIMRIASFVLVLTLLSTCAISGTFAKYTVSSEDADIAQVAKWGVTVSVLAGTADSNAFAANYATTDTTTYNGANSVEGTATTIVDRVAPGTSGTLATIAISGAPEVAVKMDYVIDLELENWTINTSEFYCPIVFAVNGTEVKMDANNTDMAKLEEALEDAIAAAIENGDNDMDDATDTQYTENVAANASLAKNVTVTWAWDFDASGAGTNDAKDTLLGDAATMASIEFEMSITATQID